MEYPDWAMQHARAALKTGIKVPDIEQQLVAKGLSAEEANALVMSIVEAHFHDSPAPRLVWDERWNHLQLALSLLFAGVCLGLVYWLGGEIRTAWTFAYISPGLVGIWLPQLLDFEGDGYVVVGWIWLLLAGCGRVFLVAMWNWGFFSGLN